MSIRTTYLATCDYPGCCVGLGSWEPTKEGAIHEVIGDRKWLCLFTGDNEPRFFCPLHLRYVKNHPYGWLHVFYDSDSPDTQPALHALHKYYEDVSTRQPLPKLECEDTILAVLTSEDVK